MAVTTVPSLGYLLEEKKKQKTKQTNPLRLRAVEAGAAKAPVRIKYK